MNEFQFFQIFFSFISLLLSLITFFYNIYLKRKIVVLERNFKILKENT